MEFCPYVPNNKISRETLKELGPDCNVDEFVVMNLRKDEFEDLCDLYP